MKNKYFLILIFLFSSIVQAASIETINLIENQVELNNDILEELVSSFVGKELTNLNISELIDQIGTYYISQDEWAGVILRSELDNPNVEFEVVRAVFGEFELNNLSNRSRIDFDEELDKLYQYLPVGDYLSLQGLEDTVQYIERYAGINVVAELKPGNSYGFTDVLLTLTDEKIFTGEVSLDNFGPAGNRNQFNFRGGVLSALGYGEEFDFVYTRNNIIDTIGGRITLPIGFQESNLEIEYAKIGYALDGDLKKYGLEGNVKNKAIGFSRINLLKNKKYNILYGIQYSAREGEDRALEIRISNKNVKSLSNLFDLSFTDNLFGGGQNSINFAYIKGKQRLFLFDGSIKDESIKRKLLRYRRVQKIRNNVNATFMISSQRSGGLLETGSKFVLSGQNSFKGLDQGSILADRGTMYDLSLNKYFENMVVNVGYQFAKYRNQEPEGYIGLDKEIFENKKLKGIYISLDAQLSTPFTLSMSAGKTKLDSGESDTNLWFRLSYLY